MTNDTAHTMTPEGAARDAFLARYTAGTRAPFASDLRIFYTWCADHELKPLEVDRVHLEYFGRYLSDERGNKTSSVRRRLSTLRTFYALCTADGRIDRNPALMLRLPRVNADESRITGLSPLDATKLAAAARDSTPDDYALVALMLYGGLRVSEAVAVRIEDTHHMVRGHRVLKFTGKGDKKRESVIAPALAVIIDDCAGDRTDGVLIRNRYGNDLTRTRAYHRVMTLARHAGIGHVHPHMLRHTAITAALDAGATVIEAREFSGHADIRTLMRYYHNLHRLDQSAAYMVAGRLALTA